MQKFHQSGQSQQLGQQQLFVDLEGTGQGIRGLQLLLSGPDAACGGGLLRHSEEIAALVPLDVGENVLGRRQGREMCPCAVQPQGSKAGGGLCGGEGGILPQHRLPQPGQQALGGPLLEQPLCAGGRSWRVSCVAVGNPHCVIFTRETPPAGEALARYGRALEHHPAFTGGINVEFVQQLSPLALTASVWERGSGATLACGTGACAAAAAAVLTGRCPRGAPILVQMPGGTLEVQVCRDDTVLLTGDAVTVFCGTVQLEPCKAPPGVV